MTRPSWGLLPIDVISQLRKREWENLRTLKSRLKGEKPFPIRMSLKPPRGNAALTEMMHFQEFIDSWKSFPFKTMVQWERRVFRHLSEQTIPVRLVLDDIKSLADVLGHSEQLHHWQRKISLFLSQLFAEDLTVQQLLFRILVDHLEEITHFTDQDGLLMMALIPQLKAGLGHGGYLRALPISTVDTKFIETNFKIIEGVTDALHNGQVQAQGGLLAWLNCKENPKGWLMVRPLCDSAQKALGGLPLLQLSTDTLLDFELPASRVLVVENIQSGLALPHMPDTIAVFGGGKNVAWMSASWLSSKKVAYWGDLDSEGLNILSDVRSKISSVKPLMMDEKTIMLFKERMVEAPVSISSEPLALAPEELRLFRNLRSGEYGYTRLEQERLSTDYILDHIRAWLAG